MRLESISEEPRSRRQVLENIVRIFETTFEPYAYTINPIYQEDWVQIKIIGQSSQSMNFGLKLSDQGYNLLLANIYMPVELKGRGLLTIILKLVRNIPELSGKCRVLVPMNLIAWQRLIDLCGFKWWPAEPHPMFKLSKDKLTLPED